MACETFWNLYWKFKAGRVSQEDAMQAAFKHFDDCAVCQSHKHPDADTSQHQDECAACHAIAALPAGAGKGGYNDDRYTNVDT